MWVKPLNRLADPPSKLTQRNHIQLASPILGHSQRRMFRSFSTSIVAYLKRTRLPPRPKIKEEDITEVFIKGGGKGGQKINKTNSKVQLKHLPTGIVVESQFSRSRDDNRKKAREILALKVEELELGGQSRAAIVAEFYRQKARKKKQKGRQRQREREGAKTSADAENSPGEPLRNEVRGTSTGTAETQTNAPPKSDATGN